MQVSNIRRESDGVRTRVAAAVKWEDRARDTQTVFFETSARYADSLSCGGDAFLVACIMPALLHGERRVAVEGEVCPDLVHGLNAATSLMRHWFWPHRQAPRVEAALEVDGGGCRTEERAALFLSGGIDSLATLRANRLAYPVEHPGSFRDGILVFGMNIESDPRPETFEAAVQSLSALADEASLCLVPVYTNARALEPDGDFFVKAAHGAVLFAVAHAFRRWNAVSIASTFDIPHLTPLGSHPLLDLHYGSCGLRIRHDGMTRSRLQKTQLVADWEPARRHIKVCAPNWPGSNCGRCRKCVSTMLALEALGLRDETPSFPGGALTADLVADTGVTDLEQAVAYEELLAPLRSCGRRDLATAAERELKRFRGELGLRGYAKSFDRRYCGGSLVMLAHAVIAAYAT